jgi:hypothetical protein
MLAALNLSTARVWSQAVPDRHYNHKGQVGHLNKGSMCPCSLTMESRNPWKRFGTGEHVLLDAYTHV